VVSKDKLYYHLTPVVFSQSEHDEMVRRECKREAIKRIKRQFFFKGVRQ